MGRRGARFQIGLAAVTVFLTVILSSVALTPPAHTLRATLAPTNPSSPASTGVNFDYLVIILMENHNLCDIMTDCGGKASFMTSLANDYGVARGDRYCNVNPSLPNYLCLTGASDFGCSGYDGNPNSNACTGVAWNAPNIVDRLLASGMTWKAYMEDMPSNCYDQNSGNYAVRHNPFVYYNDIRSDATRCARVVPAGTSDATLLSDLSSTSSASNYMWLTPNKCNDMHSDCGSGNEIAAGDAYLWNLVPRILTSNVFTTQRAALVITFDEGYGQPIYTAWAGPVVKTGHSSTVAYTHFSLLATVESNWNLPPLNVNDTNAANMSEFFSPSTFPRIVITSPTYNSVLTSSTVTVTGTANDDVAVQKVDVSTDGANWTQASGTTSWSSPMIALKAGVNTTTIYARATDNSGNQKTVRVTVTAQPTVPGTLPLPFALVVGIPIALVVAAVAVVAFLWRRRRSREKPPEREAP